MPRGTNHIAYIFSLALKFAFLLTFISEMKKILIFVAYALISAGVARAAVRDGNVSARQKSSTNTTTTQRTRTTEKIAPPRTTALTPRAATNTSARQTGTRQSAIQQGATRTTSVRATTPARTGTNVVARATTAETSAMSETRTGAAYEQCKTAFFTCMDQFCTLKNDDYRRCSCSNRVYDLAQSRQSILDAGEQLTVFTENLNVVGMTAAQATAMKTASEGENALTSDTSASKALLQAIMNSIRGEDSNVGGKYSDLNSINISFDTSAAFGVTDAGQAVANYNGQNLYSAVYPQCRNAVRDDCNNASLQRAITAYLMAIEQDCNTVEAAITEKKKQTKAAIREGSAMLDLARIENRQKHNADDIATCIANVEQAILSEEVCGANYHKCLDNGEFIDITTGTPIAGVKNFYELETLLTFPSGVDAADQKLTAVFSNRAFVQNFEKRVKKFAAPALDKCVENADEVWAEYLDKAMLDIYYAQNAKVSEIKQGCFDFVSACYMNGEKSITTAMAAITGDNDIILQPHKVSLTNALCENYVESCNNMFGNDIIKDYIANRQDTDTLTACRAVVKQCFDKYGGTNYQNFYYPYSGLFKIGHAPDWFTLYEWSTTPSDSAPSTRNVQGNTLYAQYKSECAKQLTTIDACKDPHMIEMAFGGLDAYPAVILDTTTGRFWQPCHGGNSDICTNPRTGYGYTLEPKNITIESTENSFNNIDLIKLRSLRSTGVATEVYNQIVDILNTQCTNLQGRFVEYQNIDTKNKYNIDTLCSTKFSNTSYGVASSENMCPRDYGLSVDTQSWGACLCWENGGRRSKWGKSAKCVPVLPATNEYNDDDPACKDEDGGFTPTSATKDLSIKNWCTAKINPGTNQVYYNNIDDIPDDVPKGI